MSLFLLFSHFLFKPFQSGFDLTIPPKWCPRHHWPCYWISWPPSDFILRAPGCHLCNVACCILYATPSLPPLTPFHPDAYQTCPLWCLAGAINLNDKIEHWIPISLMLFGHRQPGDSHHWDLSQHQLSIVPNNHLKTGWNDDIYFENPQRGQASDGYSSVSAGVARRLVAGTTQAPARVWWLTLGICRVPCRGRDTYLRILLLRGHMVSSQHGGLLLRVSPLRWPAGGHITSFSLLSTVSSRGKRLQSSFWCKECQDSWTCWKPAQGHFLTQRGPLCWLKTQKGLLCSWTSQKWNHVDGPCCG